MADKDAGLSDRITADELINMLDIPQNLIPLKNLLNDTGVWTWTSKLVMPDGETHRFVKNTEYFYLGEADYVASGCVCHLKMNDNKASTVVKDCSGNNNHGTAQQNTSVLSTTGKINSGLSHNGTMDKINCGNNTKLQIGTGNKTYAFWVKITGAGVRGLCHYNTTNNPCFGLYCHSSGLLYVYLRDSHGTMNQAVHTTVINDGEWHHIAVTVEHGDVLTAYIDNTAGTPVDISAYTDSISGSYDFIIGDVNPGVGTYELQGVMDDFRVFDEAVTSAKLDFIFNDNEGTERNPVRYTPCPFKISPRKLTSNGQIVTANVSISDLAGLLMADLERLGGATDAEITYTFVNTKEPAVDYSSLTYTYDVLETDWDEKDVVLQIGAPSPLRERYPPDRYFSDLCPYWLRDAVTKVIDPRCNYQPQAIEDIILSGTNPVQIEVTGHPYKTGDEVYLGDEEIGGTVELNGNEYTVMVIDANNISLDGTDSSEFTAWTSGGTIGHLDCPRNYRACDERNNLDAGQYGGEYGMLPGAIKFA